MNGNARAPAQCWMQHPGAAQEVLVAPEAPPEDEDPDVLDFESPEPDAVTARRPFRCAAVEGGP